MKNRICVLIIAVLLVFTAKGQDSDTTLLAKANVYFDFGKDEIRSSEIGTLDDLVNQIQGDTKGFIRLTGHTDAIGSFENNDDLSERRTNNVIQYLVSNRIAPSLRFYTDYKGEYTPVADNESDQGRQLNRRVEIEVFGVQTMELLVEEEVKKELPPPPPPEPVGHTKVSFEVVDEETKKPIDATIAYKLFVSDEAREEKTGEDGRGFAHLQLDNGKKVLFECYAKGYFHNSQETALTKGDDNLVRFELKPIKEGTKLALKNLYFYGNQSKLLPKSIPELHRLKNSLAMNPDAIIEIGGHINYPNTHPDDVPEWSVKLSEERAEVIYEFLVENGISADRLKHQGYSNTEMVFPKAFSEPDQAANRRVELKVLGYVE